MFKKKYRVGREAFAEVMKGGVRTSTPLFLIKYMRNKEEKDPPKYAVVVSKKIEKLAVNRNNFRRRTYYAIREIAKETIIQGKTYTILFFLRSSLRDVVFYNLKEDIRKVFREIS